MKPPAQPELSAAIDRLWVRFAPEIEQRVTVLEAAAAELASKSLTASRQQAATAAAHNLAGVLGTFDLTRGTVLARELEMVYSRETGPDAANAARLASIAAELRTIIEGRK